MGDFTYGIPELLEFKDDSTRVEIGKFCSIAKKCNYNMWWLT